MYHSYPLYLAALFVINIYATLDICSRICEEMCARATVHTVMSRRYTPIMILSYYSIPSLPVTISELACRRDICIAIVSIAIWRVGRHEVGWRNSERYKGRLEARRMWVFGEKHIRIVISGLSHDRSIEHLLNRRQCGCFDAASIRTH